MTDSAEGRIEYVLVPADLAKAIRRCEGLQEWDEHLCQRMDAEIVQVEALNWSNAVGVRWHNRRHSSGAGDGAVLMPVLPDVPGAQERRRD